MRCAIGAVVLLLAGLAASDAFGQAMQPSVLGEVAAWDGVSSAERSVQVALPRGFEDEVLAVADERELAVDERGRVVGFVRSRESEQAFSSVAEELERGGWTHVPSGWAACGSFVKGEGAYRWVFVACVEAGGATSVVVQYAMTEEGS